MKKILFLIVVTTVTCVGYRNSGPGKVMGVIGTEADSLR